MSQEQKPGHVQWSSPTIFVLAATGSVIGLGNIWKFPSLVASNGGGAFLLVYLLCLATIGIPLMMAELLMGRRARRSPIHAMRYLAEEAGRHRIWQVVGGLGILVGFLLLSYYSVIAGWSLAYVTYAAEGMFVGRPPQAVAGLFGSLVSSPELLLLWHTLLMASTMWVAARGVRSGLEQAIRYAVPGLFAVLLLMVGFAMNTNEFERGVASLFVPNIGMLSLNGVLMAMEYAFFTLAVATGAIMVYGTYLPKEVSIIKATVVVAGADTLVSLLVGMAIFPLLFTKGIEPTAGPLLAYQTLPIVFGQLPHGTLFGTLFFLLLVLAAWTTLISLTEPAVAWLVESLDISRRKAAWWVGTGAWLLGVGTVLSFNLWSEEPYLLFGKTFFYRLDYLTSNIMIPAGGLLLALFAGWRMRPGSAAEELGLENGILFRSWHFLVRFAVPTAVSVILLRATGVIHFE